MHSSFTALIFGPGLPPGGAQGRLTISSLGIEVEVSERSQRIALAEPSLREVGFGKTGVELAWRDGDDHWAVHVLDHEAARRLLALPLLANTAQVGKLRTTRRKVRMTRSLAFTLLGCFVLLPVILLLLLVLNAGAIAGWIADKIPVEQEVQMGRQVFDSMRGSLQLVDEGPAHDAAKAIVAKLTQGSRYAYEVHVARDDTLNAFALPGGVIVVHTGLIAATQRPEELAGVLAHEVQHVELRHSLRGMVKNLGLRAVWSWATGDLGGTLGGQAALEMTALKFSRDDEGEADQKGFDALVKAHIDPSGMPAFFATMSRQAADAPAAFLSTHPLGKDRERGLQIRMAELDSPQFTPLSFGGWPPVR